MQKADKERITAELAEKLRATESLIVADYRGLSNADLADLRTKLLEHGARFTVVKNTLTRRAARTAGTDQLLDLIDGPTAIAFIDTDGDTAAVAKQLVDTAAETKVLRVRGGIVSGKPITDAEIEILAKLPPVDVLKGQVVGAIVAPLTGLAALLAAPLRDLVDLIDARVAQLEEQGEGVGEAAPVEEPAAEAEPADEAEPAAEAESAEEPTAEADPATGVESTENPETTDTDSNEEE